MSRAVNPGRDRRAAVVLAGGRGSRLGAGPPKALRVLAGVTLLERALGRLRSWSDEVWVSVPAAIDLPPGPYRVIRDLRGFGPRAGPLVGLASALRRIERPWVLALAVDLPFAQAKVFDLLWRLTGRPAAPIPGTPPHAEPLGVVPWPISGPEPLLALYRSDAAPVLLAAARAGERSLVRALSALPLVRVGEAELRDEDPELESFVNLNTAEEWARAENRLAGG